MPCSRKLRLEDKSKCDQKTRHYLNILLERPTVKGAKRKPLTTTPNQPKLGKQRPSAPNLSLASPLPEYGKRSRILTYAGPPSPLVNVSLVLLHPPLRRPTCVSIRTASRPAICCVAGDGCCRAIA